MLWHTECLEVLSWVPWNVSTEVCKFDSQEKPSDFIMLTSFPSTKMSENQELAFTKGYLESKEAENNYPIEIDIF